MDYKSFQELGKALQIGSGAIRIRVADCETTGMGNSDQAIEAAYTDVVIDENGVARLDICDTALFKPTVPITQGARDIHKITDEEIAKFGWDRQLLPQFVAHRSPDIYCAHNAQFDHRYLKFPGRKLCTYKAAKRLWPHAPSHKNQLLAIWRCIEMDESRMHPAHRALPDSYVTANLLIDMLTQAPLERLLVWGG